MLIDAVLFGIGSFLPGSIGNGLVCLVVAAAAVALIARDLPTRLENPFDVTTYVEREGRQDRKGCSLRS